MWSSLGVACRCLKTPYSSALTHAVGPTQGRKARSVPVPAFVLDALSARCQGKASGDLLFPGENGAYLPRSKSSRGWFARAVKRAGLRAITPHHLAYLRIPGGVGRGQYLGLAADTRAHQRQGHARHLCQLSGIASAGRETAGQLVSARAESVQMPGGTGLLTWAGFLMLPLDA